MAQTHGDNADSREYLVVHQSLRLTLGRFVDATERMEPAALARVVGPRWAVLDRGLHHHHEVEDADFFPMLVRARPDTKPLIDRLESEHRILVGQLEAVQTAVRELESDPTDATREAVHDAIREVRDLLVPHLDEEDARLLPAAAEAIPAAEWRATSQRAMRSIPKGDLPIVAGALDEVIRSLPTDERPPPPPLPIRVLVALSWRRRYRRFVEPLLVR